MSRHQPALLGGLFIGVLSALPVVQIGNCCCCLWVVCGGLLTVYLQQQRLATPIQTSEAMLSGVFAGLIGSLVGLLVTLLLTPMVGPYQARMVQSLVSWLQQSVPNLPAETVQQLEEASRQMSEPSAASIARQLLSLVYTAPIFAIFSMLGALLGTAFFKKKVTPPSSAPVQPGV